MTSRDRSSLPGFVGPLAAALGAFALAVVACDAKESTCTAGPHMGEAFTGGCSLGWANQAADFCLAD